MEEGNDGSGPGSSVCYGGVAEVDDEDVEEEEESEEDCDEPSKGRGSGGDNRGRVKPATHMTTEALPPSGI